MNENRYELQYWLNRYQHRSPLELMETSDLSFEVYTLFMFGENFKHPGMMEPGYEKEFEQELLKCSKMLQDVLWQGLLQLEQMAIQKEKDMKKEDKDKLLS